MRCSICGAKLKKEGDICTNCYKAYQEEEDLKKDVKEVLRIKRKYSINYEFMKYTEIIVIFALAFTLCIMTGGILEAIGVLLILMVLLGLLFFVDKKTAMNTQAIFYQKKVIYINKSFLLDIDKTVKYSDISDVTFFQTHRQKRLGFGDLCIYTKDAIPGISFFKGFQIKNIENINETLEQIEEIIGTIEE